MFTNFLVHEHNRTQCRIVLISFYGFTIYLFKFSKVILQLDIKIVCIFLKYRLIYFRTKIYITDIIVFFIIV